METLANLSSSPKQSTANSKYFCWQTLFCSIKFFSIRNLLPQRPGKKGLENSVNIVKWRLHFALGPEGTIRSSHLTPALKKKGKNPSPHHNRTTPKKPQNFTQPVLYTVSKMCFVSKYLPQSHSFALDHQEIETTFSSFSRFHIFLYLWKNHITYLKNSFPVMSSPCSGTCVGISQMPLCACRFYISLGGYYSEILNILVI